MERVSLLDSRLDRARLLVQHTYLPNRHAELLERHQGAVRNQWQVPQCVRRWQKSHHRLPRGQGQEFQATRGRGAEVASPRGTQPLRDRVDRRRDLAGVRRSGEREQTMTLSAPRVESHDPCGKRASGERASASPRTVREAEPCMFVRCVDGAPPSTGPPRSNVETDGQSARANAARDIGHGPSVVAAWSRGPRGEPDRSSAGPGALHS
mmetsp:Transcript_12816/g.39493  ORF Transcript_12816/g.39493 Transcript_12816/m.39493 type:complete len:209 (-) Transcript_12816:297-923(-)